MNAIEIIKQYLRDNNLDGLYHSDTECACCLDDLNPCGEDFSYCKVGVKVKCDCQGDDHEWHIVEKIK